MRSTNISPAEYIMAEYMWNMICIFSQTRDVKNSHSILCKFLHFWSGVAEVFILLECGAASLGADQYAVLHNVMCVCIYI